jgi:hypothetical protein
VWGRRGGGEGEERGRRGGGEGEERRGKEREGEERGHTTEIGRKKV